MQPDLRHLRAFLAVAEQGSANRASASLFRAQSAVSRSVRNLERQLGVALFERRARGMLLTEFGRALLVRTRRVRDELSAARGELASRLDKSDVRNAEIFQMLTHERHVRAFVALAEQHHMPSVAESIGVTQAAVSMAVRHIEQSIGAPLFERTARGMLPNAAGSALALRLKRALTEVRYAVGEIAALQGITQGTVIVGALPLGRTQLLPESIAAVVGRHPGLKVATIEGSFETLAALLRAGEVDFIVGALRPREYAHDLDGEPLVVDELGVFCRRDHALVKKGSRVSLRQLAGVQWVLPRLETPTRKLFERALQQRGLGSPNVVVETSDLAVLRGVLLHSDLLTAISSRQLAYEIAAGLVARIPMQLPDTRRSIGITRRVDAMPWPGAKLLMDEIARRSKAAFIPN